MVACYTKNIMETILVIFGGQSAEHDVSIITAINSIITPLILTKKYKVLPLYISKTGQWYCDKALSNIELFTSGKIDNFLIKSKPVSLKFNNGLEIELNRLHTKRLKVDLVFPAMHGTFGEDGDLMGLLEMSGVVYVGCGVSASAIAMNKVLAKQLALGCNIPVSKFLAFKTSDFKLKLTKVLKNINSRLKFPIFVKPAHLGSSIGISRVKNNDELKNALELAFYYDDLVIVEEEVANLIEVTLPIIGNDKLTPALLERPMLHQADFFDFETKYLKGGKKGAKTDSKGSQGYSEVPAKLEKSLYDAAQSLGLKVYQEFGLSGIARIDMLIDSKTNKVYFNEINPMPGSLYSHNFQKAGISNVLLVEKLLQLARERFKARSSVVTTFKTNYLKQF